MAQRITSTPIWRERDNLLQSVPGVGPTLSRTLVAELPELGILTRHLIAALVGGAFESRQWDPARPSHDLGWSCRGAGRAVHGRRVHGLEARRTRRFRVVVEQRQCAPPAPNRLHQVFVAPAVNHIWVGDLTAIATRSGWLYLAVLLDLYSRRVIG